MSATAWLLYDICITFGDEVCTALWYYWVLNRIDALCCSGRTCLEVWHAPNKLDFSWLSTFRTPWSIPKLCFFFSRYASLIIQLWVSFSGKTIGCDTDAANLYQLEVSTSEVSFAGSSTPNVTDYPQLRRDGWFWRMYEPQKFCRRFRVLMPLMKDTAFDNNL